MLHISRLRWQPQALPQSPQVPLFVAFAVTATLALVGVLAQAGPLASPSEDATASSAASVGTAMRTYISEWQPNVDPLVTLDNGAQVKSSNYHGIDIDGTRYYYRLVNMYSADPISRGESGEFLSVTTVDSGTQWQAEIYRRK